MVGCGLFCEALFLPACVTATLRALYLSDNDFETLPTDIGKLTKLQIVSYSDWAGVPGTGSLVLADIFL